MDVLELRDWYRTPMGHMVRRTVQAYLNGFWSDLAGKRILVLGYGVPFIHLWCKEADIYCAMSAKSGVTPWPEGQKNRAVLVRDDDLPFADDTFDRILLVHILEFADDEMKTLSECNRILKSDGRILSVVANRSSAWSRREVSPFARGKPFSALQLQKAYRQNNFLMTQSTFALFTPPTSFDWLLKRSGAFEKMGNRWWAPFGGVVIAEGKKDIYSVTTLKKRRNHMRQLIQPLLNPNPARFHKN